MKKIFIEAKHKYITFSSFDLDVMIFQLMTIGVTKFEEFVKCYVDICTTETIKRVFYIDHIEITLTKQTRGIAYENN